MMKRWSRLLRSVGFRGAEYFPHLTSEALPVSRQRSAAGGILTVIILTTLGLLISATAIVAQFISLKTQIAGLKSELAGMQRKLVNFEAAAVATSSHRTETNHGATGRPPEIPFALSRDEIQLIRDFIKVAPPPAGAAAKIRLGDILPDFALTPIPEPITDKLPKLKGARFTIDRNGATVVVSPGTNRVDVVINPR